MKNSIIKIASAALLGMAILFGSTSGASADSRKETKFLYESSNPVVVKPGGKVDLTAQLYYKDKQGRWKWLGYKTVQVEFRILSNLIANPQTDPRGWAQATYWVPANARNGKVNWYVKFRGDPELKPCDGGNSFTVRK